MYCLGIWIFQKYLRMGQQAIEFAKVPSVWKQVEIDLLGLCHCRGDKNPRTTVKVWGTMIEDMYSRAVHFDVVRYYSA